MLEKSSYVERVLIVLNPDGTLKGAHQHTLDAITDDGVVIRESQGDAQPLDASALVAVLPTQAVLAAQVQGLQERVGGLDWDDVMVCAV